jgi:hypothetical protein
MRQSICLAGAVLALASGVAQATFIVDTGHVAVNGTTRGDAYASEFIVDETVTISLAQAFMVTGGSGFLEGAIATFAIYSDGGNVPGIKLYSDQVELHAQDTWQGVSDEHWTLQPGSYWISLETNNPGDTAEFFFGIALGLTPLGQNGLLKDSDAWMPVDEGYAWRIGTVVPLPGALLLMASGLAGLGLVRRKRAKR